MEIIQRNARTLVPSRRKMHVNLREFFAENVFASVWQTGWLVALTGFVAWYTFGQLRAAAATTAVVLIVWAVTVAMTAMAEAKKEHTPLTFWLKENMYNNITNIEVTLFLVLLILAAVRGFYQYAWVNATFETDRITSNEVSYQSTVPELLRSDGVDLSRLPAGVPFTRDVVRNPAGTVIQQKTYIKSADDPNVIAVEHREVHTGATWGSVIANLENLFIFRFKASDLIWRVYASVALVAVLALPSVFVYRDDRFRKSWTRRILSWLWLLTPVIIFFLLYGFGSTGVLRRVDPDQIWGGFLLTVIISIFGIVVSFPIGLLLALGRRSKIQGIPAWLTYPAAGLLTAYLLFTTTPANVAAARSSFEVVLAYWPLLIPLIAYLFQSTFNGNVVATFSTLYIEVVRGVPLITVLFMSIILFPIFLPSAWTFSKTLRVLAAFSLFSAAYLAENVRGGLQAISNGQYEAADSLGLSTFNKYRLIILPQALRAVIPAIVGQFIGLFKDTSLVYLVGLFDFLMVANTISSQPDWLAIRTEPYILLMFVYFIGSSIMAGYSRRLEKRLGVGER